MLAANWRNKVDYCSIFVIKIYEIKNIELHFSVAGIVNDTPG